MMLVRRAWDVLVVDDEPDVLAVTRLALKNVTVYGIPLKIHVFKSKAETIEFLQSGVIRRPALAIIDVIMESDTAGLEICNFIRNEQRNNITQLVVRTGQAGLAPEREVMEKYEISGYLSKVEATEDRLYSFAKGGVRQYAWSVVAQGILTWSTNLVEAASSREALIASFKSNIQRITTDKQGNPLEGVEAHVALFVDNAQVAGVGDYAGSGSADEIRRRLADCPRVEVSERGDAFRRDGENVVLVVAPEGGLPGAEIVTRTTFDPIPDYHLAGWTQMMRTFRCLWARG